MKAIIRLAAVVLAVFALQSCNYNSLVEDQQGVDQAWAEVENQYQRRADLIPNLVNTVKGYAKHESSTLEKVTEARAKATSITISPENLNEENLARFQQAQNGLTGALKSLLAVSEAYPDLKANQNFLELQSQLEGTENRIAVSRKDFNEAAQRYNVAIRRFPANIVARLCGFEQKPYFTADEGTAAAPKVEF